MEIYQLRFNNNLPYENNEDIAIETYLLKSHAEAHRKYAQDNRNKEMEGITIFPTGEYYIDTITVKSKFVEPQ